MRTILAALALAGAPVAAAADPRPDCADRDTLVAMLADRYGESLRSEGRGTGDSQMEVFASAETGTWTIVVTDADGTACMIATGRGFRMTPAPALTAGPERAS